MDSELMAYLDQRFRETAQQISGLRDETMQRFEQVDRRFEQVEDSTRQTLVLVEGLRSDVHLIAEGFVGLYEKLERTTLVFDEVRGWIEPYYRDLNGRLRVLEGRADRQQGDVLEAVRRLLGKPLQSPVSE